MISPYVMPGLLEITRLQKQDIPLKAISDMFCASNRITLSEIISRDRTTAKVMFRHALIYYMRKITNAGLREIAAFFGFHHSTVFHSLQSSQNWLEIDQTYKAWLESVNPYGETIKTFKP